MGAARERQARHLRTHQRATQLERSVFAPAVPHPAPLGPPHARVPTLLNTAKNRQCASNAVHVPVLTSTRTVPTSVVQQHGPATLKQSTKTRKPCACVLRMLYCQLSLFNLLLYVSG